MILLTFREAEGKILNQFPKRSTGKLQINEFEGTRFETEI